MTAKRSLMTRLLLTSVVALAIPAVQAQPPDGKDGDPGMKAGSGMYDMEHEYYRHHRPWGREQADGEHLPPMLRGVDLTDAQREQVRELMRSQSDAQRVKREALRKSHEDLWNLAMSDDYSDASLKERAAAHGRAVAEMAELHARNARQVYQLLTPEQRRQLSENRRTREERYRQDSRSDGSKR